MHRSPPTSVPLPVFRDDAWIPAPSHDGTVSLNPDPPEPVGDRPGFGRSGLLGRRWHGGRVWEIDYPQKRFLLHAVPPAESWTTTAPLGFRERNGERLFHFPRVQVSVDGEILDVLFDTGAHTRLSSAAAAAAAVGAAGSVIATSFIIETVAQRWRDRHPDWPVVQGGEAGSEATMIRAASVLIGGVDVGPVWFTQRADANFLEHMSQWMDKPVVGAIGGNAFHRLRLLVDYPGALLHLHEASHA